MLKKEISIEIKGVDCDKSIRDKVAKKVGTIVKKMFPSANVDCDFIEYGPHSGHWSSKEEAAEAKEPYPFKNSGGEGG